MTKRIFSCMLIIFAMLLSTIITEAATYSSLPAAPYSPTGIANLSENYMLIGSYIPPVKQDISGSELIVSIIDYYNKLYSKSGYDFQKSINEYVHNINIGGNQFLLNHINYIRFLQVSEQQLFEAYYKSSKNENLLLKYFSVETKNYFNKLYDQAYKNRVREKIYWFPSNVDSSKLTTAEQQQYIIVTEEELNDKLGKDISNPFVQIIVNNAEKEERPILQKDYSEIQEYFKITDRSKRLLQNKGLKSADSADGIYATGLDRYLKSYVIKYGVNIFDADLTEKLQYYCPEILKAKPLNKKDKTINFLKIIAPITLY